MMTILLCDRDPLFAEAIERLLAEAGYTVETTNRPEEAISRLLPKRFGAMIFGLHSEKEEDAETIPVINRIDRQLPIIAIAEDDSLDLERRARKGKLFYYAVRPIDIEEVKEVVNQAVMRSKPKF
jgi:DNA-binding NtrC family response regulator